MIKQADEISIGYAGTVKCQTTMQQQSAITGIVALSRAMKFFFRSGRGMGYTIFFTQAKGICCLSGGRCEKRCTRLLKIIRRN